MHILEALRKFSPRRRHPRPGVLSDYLDGGLDGGDRVALEAHVRDCARCQGSLGSLATTIRSLGSLDSLGERSPTGVANSIIVALRSESPAEFEDPAPYPIRSDLPALTIVHGSAEPSAAEREAHRRGGALAALRYCLQRARLRFTLPIALLAGVVLSLVNQGGMLADGRVDLGMCAMCAMNFFVPFVALNVGAMIVLLVPDGGRRSAGRRPPPAD